MPWYQLMLVLIVATSTVGQAQLSPCDDGLVPCTSKGGKHFCVDWDNPWQKECRHQDCPENSVPLKIGSKVACVPIDLLADGTNLPATWRFNVCQSDYQVNCGINTTICLDSTELLDYDLDSQLCILPDCPEKPSSFLCTLPDGLKACTYFSYITAIKADDVCEMSSLATICPLGQMNCGVYEPICVEVVSPTSRNAPLQEYNDRTRECSIDGCPHGHHPCNIPERGDKKICMPYSHIQSVGEGGRCNLMDPNKIPDLKPAKDCAGLNNTVACWAGDDYACFPFERLTSIRLDDDNKTICRFGQCPEKGKIPCSEECHHIDDIQAVKPDGSCEYRKMRRGTIIIIVACSIIGAVVLIGLVALVARAVLKRNDKTRTADRRDSSTTSKLQKDSDDEKRPFMPSKKQEASKTKHKA
ncbi:unnamed protein product, partial [Mesorhabditis spiculigera]